MLFSDLDFLTYSLVDQLLGFVLSHFSWWWSCLVCLFQFNYEQSVCFDHLASFFYLDTFCCFPTSSGFVQENITSGGLSRIWQRFLIVFCLNGCHYLWFHLSKHSTTCAKCGKCKFTLSRTHQTSPNYLLSRREVTWKAKTSVTGTLNCLAPTRKLCPPRITVTFFLKSKIIKERPKKEGKKLNWTLASPHSASLVVILQLYSKID